MAVTYLGDSDTVWGAPLGEVQVDAQGGTDRLVLDWGTVTGPIIYWNDGWGHYADEAFNQIDFANFESLKVHVTHPKISTRILRSFVKVTMISVSLMILKTISLPLPLGTSLLGSFIRVPYQQWS